MFIRLFENMFQPFHGFIQGHDYLKSEDMASIRYLVDTESNEVVEEFESRFAKLIGDGQCVSYAAGRMGFYDLMGLLNIGAGDEVILLGSTCSVMCTSVLRRGAIPIYSDIDPRTFGSCPDSIVGCISDNTKMIVAQHSFGIPCDIERIQAIADERNIFLLEDCALTLGSSIKGVSVGNFGDAALFSTDHSKPLNTITGGCIYSRSERIIESLKSSQQLHGELTLHQKKAIWIRFRIEKLFCNPQRQKWMALIDIFYAVFKRLNFITDPFLSDDYLSVSKKQHYPYPSKLPSFLAKIGCFEICRWAEVSECRKDGLAALLDMLNKTDAQTHLPQIYSEPFVSIIPLRLVWSELNGPLRRQRLRRIIKVDWTWFMVPIISTREPLENFKYISGSCPLAEATGRGMVNIPCNVGIHDFEKLTVLIEGCNNDKVL